MSYYKFKDREDPKKSMIDWGSITKELSDGIMKERTRRLDLKQELAETHVKNLNKLEEFNQGLDKTRNLQMQNWSSQYKDFLYQQNKLLKAGQLSPSDYKIAMQGSMDTFKTLNDAMGVYNERLQTFADAGGNINDFFLEELADLADMSDKQLIIDPATGLGSIAKLDENGEIIPNSIIPINKIAEIGGAPVERFDMTAAVDDAVKNAGTWIEAASAYSSVKDLRQNKEYTKWLDSRAESIMAKSMDGAQIAADYGGMEITKNRAEAEANPEKYLFAENKGGDFKITYINDEQRKKVKDAIKSEIEIAIDREETKKAPSEAAINRGNKAKEKKQTMKMIKDALEGDEGALRSLAREAGFKMASVRDGELVFVDNKGQDVTPIDLSKGINTVGGEIAATLGLGAQDFRDWYKGNAQVALDKVSEFTDYTTPAERKFYDVKDIKNPEEISQYTIQYEDSQTGEIITKNRPPEAVISIARMNGISKLAGIGITDVEISDDGSVSYQGEPVNTNVLNDPSWYAKVVDEANKISSSNVQNNSTKQKVTY